MTAVISVPEIHGRQRALLVLDPLTYRDSQSADMQLPGNFCSLTGAEFPRSIERYRDTVVVWLHMKRRLCVNRHSDSIELNVSIQAVSIIFYASFPQR